MSGSCKVNRTCPAHIACTIDMTTGRVQVNYCSLHAGHGMELGHLRLSAEARLQVAALLQQGVPVSTVMDTMRDQLGSTLERDNLLCRLVELNVTHPPDHSHLCLLKCHLIFFPYRPGLASV